jgi:hypothetical protein
MAVRQLHEIKAWRRGRSGRGGKEERIFSKKARQRTSWKGRKGLAQRTQRTRRFREEGIAEKQVFSALLYLCVCCDLCVRLLTFYLLSLVQSRLPKFNFVLGLARCARECTLARSQAAYGAFK